MAQLQIFFVHFSDLLNKSVFEKCKRGVRIVNVARGGIVNEEDLFDALEVSYCVVLIVDYVIRTKNM